MNQIVLKVSGMSCGHCVASVESAVKAAGASGKVDLSAGTVEVTYNGSELSLGKIKEAIEEQGYDVV